jgi:hypothetical protein
MKDLVTGLPDILRAAATSGLGMLGLLIVIVAIIGYTFFRGAPYGYRLAVFLLFFAGAASFAAALFRVAPGVLSRAAGDEGAGLPASASPPNRTGSVNSVCVEAHLAALRATQPFSTEGGVQCGGGGPLGRGETRTAPVVYQAPPGYSIDGNVAVTDLSNINGSYGPVVYGSDQGHVVSATVQVQCRSPDQPFGPGGSMHVRLSGSIEIPVPVPQAAAARETCRNTPAPQ